MKADLVTEERVVTVEIQLSERERDIILRALSKETQNKTVATFHDLLGTLFASDKPQGYPEKKVPVTDSAVRAPKLFGYLSHLSEGSDE